MTIATRLAAALALALAAVPASAFAATGGQLLNGKQQFVDANGAPLAGGSVYVYQAGTTTPVSTYQDPGLSTPNTSPVALDARGQASIWAQPGVYREQVYDGQGDLIWDQPVSAAPPTPSEPASCYPAATDASVRACLAQAQATGQPMVVHMPPSPVTLTAPLPLVANVRFVCVTPAVFDPAGHIPSGSLPDNWDFVGGIGHGTLFIGNGSFSAFQAQKATNAQWDNAFIVGAEFDDCGFTNFTRAFDVGSTNAAGTYNLRLKDIFINKVVDGFYLANSIMNRFDGVWVNRVSYSCGQLVSDVPTQQYESGNAFMNSMECDPGNTLQVHGWIFTSTPGSVFGTLNFRFLQVDAVGGSMHAESVAVTGGSSALPVAHIEDYPVGAIVQVDGATVGTGSNALTGGRYYAVLSQSVSSGAGTISLASKRSGSTITPNGSGTITLTNFGWPLIDINAGGVNGAYAASLIGSYFGGLDLEAQAGQPLIYAEGGTANYFQFNAGVGNTAVFRNSFNSRLDSTQVAFNVDADNFFFYNGFMGSQLGAPGYGISCGNPLGVCGLGLGDLGASNSNGYSLYLSNPGGPLLQDVTPLAEPVRTDGGISYTANAGICYVDNEVAGLSQTITFPALSTTASANYTGCHARVYNNQTTANGVVSIVGNVGQTFGGISVPIVNVPYHQQVDFQVLNNATQVVTTQPNTLGVTHTFAQLPACTPAMENMDTVITDSTSQAPYVSTAGGGNLRAHLRCLGGVWLVN